MKTLKFASSVFVFIFFCSVLGYAQFQSSYTGAEIDTAIGVAQDVGSTTGPIISDGSNNISAWDYDYSDLTNAPTVGDVSASANLTNDAVVAGDGGVKGVQTKPVTISDDGIIAVNGEYTLPNADGTANQVLKTDGSGAVTFQDDAGADPGGSDTQLQYNDGGSFGGLDSVIYDDTNLEIADDFRLAFGTDADWLMSYEEANEDGLVFQSTATDSSNIGYAMFGISVDTSNSGMASNQKVFQIGKGAQDAGDANYEELLGLDEDGDLVVGNSLTVAGPVNFTAGEVISDAEVADDITIGSGGSVDDGAIPAGIARDTELPTQASLSVDDLITLSGVSEGSTDFGTFTGSTISDSNTLKPILQELETAVESVGGGHDAVTLAADIDAILGLSTQELSLDTQSANTVFAGPASGADADPTFRALVANDIPDLSETYVTSESDPIVGAINGIVEADGEGNISEAENIGNITITLGDDADTSEGRIGYTTDTFQVFNGTSVLDVGSLKGPNAGDTYTNYGAAGDDTIDELFAAIDTSWPSDSGAPTDAPYITSAADATLSNESVLSDEASLYGLLSDVTDFVQTSELSYYTDSDVDAHLSGGTGIGYSAGTISNTDTGSDAVTSHESTYNHDNFTSLTNEASLYSALSDVTDFVQPGELDYFTGADITGSEAAFDGWDKNSGDDFSGSYADLSNLPTNIDEDSTDDWTGIGDVPTASPSNGDTAHLSTADQVYDWVVGLGYTSYSDADIDGTETAFDGWDKDASNDAPTDVDYWVGTADATLSAEQVVDSAASLETAANLGAYASDLLGTTSEANFKSTVNLEIGTDVLAQQTIGIGDDNLVEMDDADAADNDYAKFTANGLEGMSVSEVRVDISAISNSPSDGSFDPVSTIEGTAGEALSFGDVVFSANNSGSHNWYAYEATTAADGHAFARGIVVESGGISSSASGTIMTKGTIQDSGWSMSSNSDEGSQVYASDTTAGGILTTAPSDTDDIVQILGFVLEEDIIYFNPDYTTVVVP